MNIPPMPNLLKRNVELTKEIIELQEMVSSLKSKNFSSMLNTVSLKRDLEKANATIKKNQSSGASILATSSNYFKN